MAVKRAMTLMSALSMLSTGTIAGMKVDYEVSGETVIGDRAPSVGSSGFVVEIDGASFRITPRYGAVEVSSDDGATTYFGREGTTPQRPLAAPPTDAAAPIQGTFEDERLVVGGSRPGPTLFGLPTRIYAVDQDYAIGARVAYVFTNRTRYHAHYAMTVVDVDASPAAVRVALSRGYPLALSQRGDAFTGLPVEIDGTIESGSGPAHGVTRFRVHARSVERR